MALVSSAITRRGAAQPGDLVKLPSLLVMCALATACGQRPSAAENASGRQAMAQCAKDTDCKGDRICESGRCTEPNASGVAGVPILTPTPTSVVPAPTAPTPPAPVSSLKFKDYAVPVYKGPAGKLDMSSEDARTYKSRLTEAMQEPADFAGEYVLATWGCGSGGCISQTFVNRRTGHVIKQGFGSSSAYGITDDMGEDIRMGDTIEGMKADSRLLVVREQTDPNEEDEVNDIRASAKFYVLEGGELKLIKTVQLPTPVIKVPSYD